MYRKVIGFKLGFFFFFLNIILAFYILALEEYACAY